MVERSTCNVQGLNVITGASSQDSLWPSSLLGYDLTLSTASENLALDEVLLARVDADPTEACLRFWEPTEYLVVLGRSNRAETEVNIGICEAEGIPILRRASGGGTVLVGPGCLCYTLALPLADFHRARGVSNVTAKVMERMAAQLRVALPDVAVCGTSDLVWKGQKFSGNAQRWSRQSFVHHGTLLYDFDLSLLARYLAHPAREPVYRQSRSHFEFVTNVDLSAGALRSSLGIAWNAVASDCPEAVLDEARKIAALRYGSRDWLR